MSFVDCNIMLTHKQSWRKSKVRKLSVSQIARRSELEYERSKNNNHLHSNGTSNDPFQKQSSTVLVKEVINKKCVRFSSTVFVLLIPNRQEISSYSGSLYWGDANYATFKKEAVDEIRAVLAAKKMTAKEAIQFLYQPVHPIYDDDFSVTAGKFNAESASISSPVVSTESRDIPSELANGTIRELDSDSDGLRDMCFITSTKTDLELNKEAEDEEIKDGKEHARPYRTPSGAGASKSTWAVQWRKATNPNT